jgi:carboxypeptidase family protein
VGRRIALGMFVALWAAWAGAQPIPQISVTGVVQDQTGAVLPGATVELLSGMGAPVQSTTADGAGVFRFEHVPAGPYEIRAMFEGFSPASTRVRVAARSPAPQKLVLQIAALKQEVTVSNVPEVDTTASHNLDTVAVDQDTLAKLPIFDQDYIATLSRFLDAGSLGTGGVSLVVNGMEVSALRVSASAVQQIKINQDPYSAEYARPGRGRIEILTKPGGQTYHGEGNAIFRDASLDARNAFASTKPPEQKHIVEGVFGGPVGKGDKTSFLISAHNQTDDQQALIFALGPTGTIQGAVSQPNRQSLVSASLTRQLGANTTISLRPSWEYESNGNRGVGGTTLATAGTNFAHNEQQLTYTQQSIIRPSLVNQFQLLVGHEREPTTSTSDGVGLVVAGAFTGGGAQGDLLRTEVHMQLTESLAWTKGRHLVQAGFQLPDWSRRGFSDHTNSGGTFYFSGLDTYAAGQPYAFIQQAGNGDLAFLEKQVGAYIKDDWQMSGTLSVSLGMRYDWQNYFHDDNHRATRLDGLRAKQNECPPRGAGHVHGSQRPGGDRGCTPFAARRAGATCGEQSVLSGSVHKRRSRGDDAAEHRTTRAERADSPNAAIQRWPRPSTAEAIDAVAHLYRSEGVPPVSIARCQRAAAAVVRDAPRPRIWRGSRDRV